MLSLSVFEFDAQGIEIALIDGNPWFNASQVTKALGYANPSKALQDNVSVKYNRQLDLGRPGKSPNFINEPGLYQLVMRSSLPSAERFQSWVFEEVLPKIRKTGNYATSQERQPTIKDELDVINLCLTAAGLDPKLTAGVMLNHAGTRMPQLKCAVEEGHSLLAASLESDLLLTPTKIGKELGVSGRRVNQVLLDLGYQVKNLKKTSKTEPDYLVTDIGKPYAGNTLATGNLQNGKPDSTTYQHLKWKQEVIKIVKKHLPD